MACITKRGSTLLAASKPSHAVAEELARINVHQRGLYQINMEGLNNIGNAISELLSDRKQQREPERLGYEITNVSLSDLSA